MPCSTQSVSSTCHVPLRAYRAHAMFQFSFADRKTCQLIADVWRSSGAASDILYGVMDQCQQLQPKSMLPWFRWRRICRVMQTWSGVRYIWLCRHGRASDLSGCAGIVGHRICRVMQAWPCFGYLGLCRHSRAFYMSGYPRDGG